MEISASIHRTHLKLSMNQAMANKKERDVNKAPSRDGWPWGFGPFQYLLEHSGLEPLVKQEAP